MNGRQDVAAASNAFSPLTSQDRAGSLWILSILGIIYTCLSGAVRARVKWGLYGADDYLLGIATVLHFVQSAVIFYGLEHGLCKFNSITSEDDWKASGKSFLASELISIAVLCFCKCSALALIIRALTLYWSKEWFISFGLLLLNAFWGLGSMIGLAVNCDFRTVLSASSFGECPHQFLRWQVVTAVDVATEIANSIIPISFLWPIHMRATEKYQLVLFFTCRLPMVVLSVYHLIYVKQLPASAQPQFAVTDALLLQQAMLTFSLITTTIPNMKGFLIKFSTGFGIIPGDVDRHTLSRENSYPLQALGPSRGAKREPARPRAASTSTANLYQSEARESVVLRPRNFQHEITIERDISTGGVNCEEMGPSRDGSHELIIKKEVRWEVSHETCSRDR